MLKRSTSLGAGALVAVAVLLVTAAPAVARHHRSRRLGPIEGRLHIGRGETNSSNWSGYAAFGSTFTQAEGSWEQPTANCNLKGRQFSLAAFWVGLDGYNSNTVEQTGTEADCEGKQPYYYAWYELYPERLYLFEGKVEPEDQLHAKVTQSTLFLEDETQGWKEEVSYEGKSLDFNSAEWIAEAPFQRFTDFGSVHFSGATASVGGDTRPVGLWEHDKITLTKGNRHHPKLLAEPSPLDKAGLAFTITQP